MMKKINSLLILFLLSILSSCNKYIGTIEPNYEPTNNVTDVFAKETTYKEIKNLSININIHPKYYDNKINYNIEKIKKLQNVDQNTDIIFMDSKIYFNFKKSIIISDEFGEINKIKINLDKNEKIIFLFEYDKKIYFVTDNSKLFKLSNNSYDLIADLNTFIGNKPFNNNGNLVLFTIFGEVYELSLNDNIVTNKGQFLSSHGFTDNFELNQSNGYYIYLYNSNTLLILDKTSNELIINYYKEDLNILSTIGTFSDLLDTPFLYEGYYYFVDRSGLISLFNPINSDILWEIDIFENIVDYSFSSQGYLTLMTFSNIYIYDKNGDLIKFFNHGLENPISLFIINESLHIMSKIGISSFNLNSKSQYNFIKNKFSQDLELYFINADIFIKDSKNLYIIE